MDNLTLIIVILSGLLGLIAVAALVILPWRLRAIRARRAAPLPVPPPPVAKPAAAAPQTSWSRLLLGYLGRPLLVLSLTWAVLGLLEHYPHWLGGLTWNPDPRYVKAWTLFWIALLLFNINEWAGRYYYYVKKNRESMPEMLFFLLRIFLIGATAFAIFHFVLDFDTSHLLTSTAVIAAMLGIAMREVLGHFLAGASLNMAGTVEPSQWIALGDKEGEIIQRNWRETRIRSTGGHIYVIPNSSLAGAVISNMTWQSPLRRHFINLTLAHGSSPQVVREALVEAALSVPEVDRSYKLPDAFVQEFRDYGTVYQLRFWSKTYFDRSSFEGKVRERVWYQLKRRGLEIPFPDGGTLPLFMRDQWFFSRPDPAANWQLFVESGFVEHYLTRPDGTPMVAEAPLRAFVATLRGLVFGTDEVVLRQGSSCGVCYLVCRGRLHGQVMRPDGSEGRQFVVERAELLGVVGLLADLPHGATVVAKGEVELLEVTPDSLGMLLEQGEEVRESVGQLVALRSRQMAEDLQASGSAPQPELQDTRLMDRLKGLLRLKA